MTKSSDSSSSDSSDDERKYGHKKDKKEKKDKKDKKDKKSKDKHQLPPPQQPQQQHQMPAFNQQHQQQQQQHGTSFPPPLGFPPSSSPYPPHQQQGQQQPHSNPISPPPYANLTQRSSAAAPPPAGNRVPCNTSTPFPTLPAPTPSLSGHPPPAGFTETDGTPVYVASAILGSSVHPAKAGAHLPCNLAYGGAEIAHQGRYDILPLTGDMEWVRASGGRLPQGRRLVEGGYEDDGRHLYHAAVWVQGTGRVPGKTGEHLGGANVGWGGQEITAQEYEVLCWR